MMKHDDLRGAARLAVEATAGLVGLVEAMHARIASPAGGAGDGRTRGITGLVYRSIHGVTRLVGGSIDALLGLLGPALQGGPRSPEREALVAALNGVLGDHLEASGNPLATPMGWRRDGRPLTLEGAGPRVLVLLHGLCMNDLQWQRDGHDHGAMLARELGFTPVYLHYNSGRHISANGRDFALALDELLARWPVPVQRLAQLGDLVFLGTPHQGAPLERIGNGIDRLLAATPYAAPFARLGKVRSAGITDLRHASLLEADWAGRDRFARHPQPPQAVPLPPGVRCFALAACSGSSDAALKTRLLGDGLVPLASALGRHRDKARALAFAAERQRIVYSTGHLELLGSAEVGRQLATWLAAAP